MERSDMSRKLWLSIAALAIGAGLLVAAGVASPASSGNAKAGAVTAKKGGTLRLSKSTDVDYVDPALAYFTDTWELQYITQAKLYNYPDKGGATCAAGPRDRKEDHDLQGRQDLHVHAVEQLQVQHRPHRPGGRLRQRVQP